MEKIERRISGEQRQGIMGGMPSLQAIDDLRGTCLMLLQELEAIVFELSKEERVRRLHAYRAFSQAMNTHKNFVSIMLTVAKWQEDHGQDDSSTITMRGR